MPSKPKHSNQGARRQHGQLTPSNSVHEEDPDVPGPNLSRTSSQTTSHNFNGVGNGDTTARPVTVEAEPIQTQGIPQSTSPPPAPPNMFSMPGLQRMPTMEELAIYERQVALLERAAAAKRQMEALPADGNIYGSVTVYGTGAIVQAGDIRDDDTPRESIRRHTFGPIVMDTNKTEQTAAQQSNDPQAPPQVARLNMGTLSHRTFETLMYGPRTPTM